MYNFKPPSVNISWGSTFLGAAAATTAAVLITAKPRDPTFTLLSLDLTSLKLNFPFLDAELILTVHVTNPNVVSIHYPPTHMFIFYDNTLLGSAPVDAGSQGPKSCQTLRLVARLSGLELAHHLRKFVGDVARREMVLDAKVEICGVAKVVWWEHRFKVKVDSRVVVDPVFLDVVEQENKSKLEVFVVSDDDDGVEKDGDGGGVEKDVKIES